MTKSNKRKSESALPTGNSSKHRKTSDSKYKEVDHNSGDESDGLFVQQKSAPKHVKKTRKSEPARARRNDEYDTDEGRVETQNFLSIIAKANKEKKLAAKAISEWLDNFKAGVKSTDEELKRRLDNLTTESDSRAIAFITTFKEVYASSRPLPPSSHPEDLSFETLFDRSKTLVNNALSLVTQFHTVNEKTENLEVAEILDAQWGEENTTAARMLEVGAEVAEGKYQALLYGREEPTLEGDEEELGFARMMLRSDEKTDADEGKKPDYKNGWGIVAKRSERAARKLLKHPRVSFM